MFACWLSGLCSSFSGEVLPGVCRSCRIFPVHGTSEPPWRPGDVYCCTFWRGFSTTSKWLFYNFKTAVGTVCRCQFFMAGCGHFGSGAAFPLVHMCLYMPVFVSPELSKKPACPLPGSLFCSGSFLCHPLETLERVNCAIAFFTCFCEGAGRCQPQWVGTGRPGPLTCPQSWQHLGSWKGRGAAAACDTEIP